ncbi:hypothetical protein N9051_00755 [Akkermansiaceae bacterium]|nr:hypothetical protein [Akkermansiaceae bacterium]
MKIQSTFKAPAKNGFTLAESVIALGILVVLITGFLAVFGPAANAIRRTLSAQEASRLQTTLEREMSARRPGDDLTDFDSSFEKAFSYIATSHEKGQTVLIYNYRGSLVENRTDGTAVPEPEVTGVAGEDYLVLPMVRKLDDPLLEDDFEAIEGSVFFVKMTQLVYQESRLKVAEEPGEIVDPHDPGSEFTTNSSEYPEAMIAFEAQFFILPTRSISYLRGPFDPEKFTRPVFRRNIGIGR